MGDERWGGEDTIAYRLRQLDLFMSSVALFFFRARAGLGLTSGRAWPPFPACKPDKADYIREMIKNIIFIQENNWKQ